MNQQVADPAARDTSPRHTHVLIIGSGFSGVGTAIRLSHEGYTDFLVLERGNDVGGTWRDNSYPGAACDVPSQLYSYSFALNPNWSRSFSKQPEIHRYIREVSERYGVRDKHIFGCEVTGARWNDAAGQWEVQTSQGLFIADVVVAGAGPLSDPNLPDIKGIHTYEGEIFHSARWDHTADLQGKRVAVIGTGASAMQIVPSIAPEVAHLDVYQRTAPWILPHFGRRYLLPERLAYKYIPGLQRLIRTGIYSMREGFVFTQAKYPVAARFFELVARVKMWLEIRDPELRRKATPNHRLGCKRMLISSDYYPTLARADVDLVTDGIKEIREHSIVTSDDTEREVDAIVLATGFNVSDSATYDLFTGRDGRTIAEIADIESVQAYKGTVLNNFPNLFVMLGPNSGTNYTSLIYVIESQINYIIDALATMKKQGLQSFEVRRDVQVEYNRQLRQQMASTVWLTGGCHSWFLDEKGTNTMLWPDFSFRLRRILRKFDLDAFDTTARANAPVAVAD
ncbi:flavin-containing monooxygenase [Nocardia sp. NBC_01499]|uniref:flavin-containing monooxygenase n=1 Tax=Nocardia sp. NBC_01499 TaxID=2903597 RepID=UPI003866D48A